MNMVWDRGLRWGWRRLNAQEASFIALHFGVEQASWLVPRVRVGVRRLGDTRRALCLNSGWMSFPIGFYVAGDGQKALRLENPQVAGVFAHELLHELQRRNGLPVTRQALLLQCRYLLARKNPYSYSAMQSAGAMLRQFWRANVEQQGQMWQDHVQAVTAGKPLTALAGIARAVQSGRLKSRHVKRSD